MKKFYFLIVLFALAFSTSYAQITSIALVGEAAGGWPGDPGNPGPADVHQLTSTDGGINWTLASVTLTAAQAGGGVKFRANNAWATSWGNAAFPTGTATAGGSNINCTSGTFSVTFNTTTLAYVFTAIASEYPTIAIVGSATAQGWPNDPQVDELQLNTSDGITYRSNFIPLIAGDLKFRQNNDWAVSWGGVSFPTGPQAGTNENIVVTTPGTYRVVINIATGVYTFDFPTISIVGEAVGGWPTDPGNPGPIDLHQLTTTDGETYMISDLVVTTAAFEGGAKFRQDNAWTTSWGNEAFPMASSSNGNNILTVAGTYDVTFTRSTGAYNFSDALHTSNFTKSKVVVFPNPTSSVWSFSANSELIKSIKISDVSGKVIYATNVNRVDASGYANGIYFALIETEAATQTIKLIKQ
ncbi:T9SS type A sorting domain-containing protein [Flavobacterium sp. SM2513]|uniref:T9SS type A sorting domain-containing protein n=1 Tax=Flavobacterium sp. SM2513 TaxID=3424766 RepID=UPI003D7FC993